MLETPRRLAEPWRWSGRCPCRPLQTDAALQNPQTLNQTALRKVIAGVPQRHVSADLEADQPLPEGQHACGASKSSVSRRWIAATEATLAAQGECRLDDRRYTARGSK